MDKHQFPTDQLDLTRGRKRLAPSKRLSISTKLTGKPATSMDIENHIAQRFKHLMCQGLKPLFMRKMFLISGIFLLFFASCKKDANTISIRGLYKESSPVAGPSQLNFINNRLVIKSESGSNHKDTLSYSIASGKIQLKPTWTKDYPAQQFDFEKVDANTIKIENLYPNIPQDTKTYMTFEK